VAPIPHLRAPLTDGDLVVREWTRDDEPAMVAMLNEDAIARWTRVPSPYRASDAEEFLARREAQREAGEAIALAIVLSSGELAGSMDLRVTSPENRRGELGYLVAAAARGQSVAPRAVRLVARWGFEERGLERIEIFAATANPASQRVAEKAGFTREGVLRSYTRFDEDRLDMVAFSLLPEDITADQLGSA
jgi:RimJ/RimL family protein N-acetyltransferase